MSDSINDAINAALSQFEIRPIHMSAFVFRGHGEDHKTIRWTITLGYLSDRREAHGKTLDEAVEAAKALPPAEDPVSRQIRELREQKAKLDEQIAMLDGGAK
jgi:hypothetical protein